jgi:hypothetical protein
MDGNVVWWELIQVVLWGIGFNFVVYSFGFVAGSWKQFLEKV